jgi:hypothetical protein
VDKYIDYNLIKEPQIPKEETAVDEMSLSRPALERDRKNGRLLLEKYKSIFLP